MFTLTQSQRVRGSSGQPLPVIYRGLAKLGIVFRRGELCLLCAGPGTGKSALVLSYALKAKVACLYFSADSNAFSQLTRSIAILTGSVMSEAAQLVLDGGLDRVRADLAGHPIRLDYEANPTLDDIELGVQAYEEVYGHFPTLIVIDNVTNVRHDAVDEGGEYAGLEGLMDWLHGMARQTQACVIALHHVTAMHNDGAQPIPLSGVKGQISRVPEMVLTLHKRDGDAFNPDVLCVSPVKNRGGDPDPTGHTYAELAFDGARMSIRDLEAAA